MAEPSGKRFCGRPSANQSGKAVGASGKLFSFSYFSLKHQRKVCLGVWGTKCSQLDRVEDPAFEDRKILRLHSAKAGGFSDSKNRQSVTLVKLCRFGQRILIDVVKRVSMLAVHLHFKV